MKKEIWKPVKHWEGKYEVSNKGRIRCITTEQIVITTEMCKLGIKGKAGIGAVHRIVLEAFVGLRPEGMVCRHLDGNGLNNNLSNLKWGTVKENYKDMVKHGRSLRGFHHSEESKRKMSIAKMGNKNALGHCHSKKTRKRISHALMGNKNGLKYRL